MQVLIMVGQLILGLSILVIIHEFGHFITARMFGIKVEKFYLFFDAWNIKLFKIKYKETEYGIGWLPLGGYVKIAGMIDESMDKEQLKKPPQPWEFRSKPAWQKFIVMIGGVVMNLILGVLIFTFSLKSYTKVYIPMEEVNKYGLYTFDYAEQIGFKTGDKIISANGKKIERYKDVFSPRKLFGTTYQVERNGEIIDVTTPDTLYKIFTKKEPDGLLFMYAFNFRFAVDSVVKGSEAEKAGLMPGDSLIAVNDIQTPVFGKFKEVLSANSDKRIDIIIKRDSNLDTLTNVYVDSLGTIGFYNSRPRYNYKHYTINDAFKYGTKDAIGVIVSNVKGLGKIVSGEEKAKESLRGPLGILEFYGRVWDWQNFWFITAMLSLVLAFMNILPIPALDGGHVMIILIESIIGRKLPDKVLEVIQIIGLVIILALMVIVFGIDISRFFGNN